MSGFMLFAGHNAIGEFDTRAEAETALAECVREVPEHAADYWFVEFDADDLPIVPTRSFPKTGK